MGLCDPQNCLFHLWIGFPVFARISRVRVFEIGPKFHRLSVSWPYNCVKSLKKVGYLSLEIWDFVTPKIAPLDRVSCVCKDISSSRESFSGL